MRPRAKTFIFILVVAIAYVVWGSRKTVFPSLTKEERTLILHLQKYPDGMLYTPSGHLINGIPDLSISRELVKEGYLSPFPLGPGTISYIITKKASNYRD